MGNRRYVQHISGQGEKWEVDMEGDNSWRIICPWKCWPGSSTHLFLPKSEYRLCDPPERWEDVTAKCVEADAYCASQQGRGTIQYREVPYRDGVDIFHPVQRSDYRLRKVCDCDPMPSVAFIVERKVS